MEMHGSPLTLNPYNMLNGRSVMGSLFGGIKSKVDIPMIADKCLNNVRYINLMSLHIYETLS